MTDFPSSLPPARLALAGTIALGLGLAGAAHAQTVSPEEFAKVKAELARQAEIIEAQQKAIEALQAQRDEMLASTRAMGVGSSTQLLAAAQQQTPNAVSEAPPVQPVAPAGPAPSAMATRPVGEAPPVQERADADAIPPGLGVLTPKGHFVFDPSVEYVRSSNNRLVFRGVELVSGILVGAIDANNVGRDTGAVTLAGRYGLTNRMEVEARVPYVWRHDSFTTVRQAQSSFEQVQELDGRSLGDVEVAARYQLNYGRGGWPIFVANLRAKAPTGTGPYDVKFDENGVAQELSTGSGFWGAEAGVTMLYPTDPAIIFGGLSYLHNFGRDFNRPVRISEDSEVTLLHIDPGDAISASLGFGLSLNPRFSVSFGYSHSYILPTKTRAREFSSDSQALQVGSLMMGWSFRLTPRLTLNNSFEFGVTSDAPDARIVLRMPYRF